MAQNDRENAAELLPGVQVTPEAQAILNKQLNRSIVWRYKSTRLALKLLALCPLLISGFVVFAAWDLLFVPSMAMVVTLVAVAAPCALAWWLYGLACKY